MNRITFTILVIFLIPPQALAAKKECSEYLDKLDNIQSKQRQGQSLKSSVRLREQEDKARSRWWDCEKNGNKAKRKNKQTAPKKSTAKIFKAKQGNSQVFSSNKLVIKGKYSGKKQADWLTFYQRPQKCARPKTTQVFAFCMDHKEKQQIVFEQGYEKDQ